MKYYVFKKKCSTPVNCTVILKHQNVFYTKDFDAALDVYNSTKHGALKDETVFLLVDFGITKPHQNYLIPEVGYFPFFILECSDPEVYDYEALYGMTDIRLVCLSDCIEQSFNSPLSAIKKFEYYIQYRIGSTLCIKYTLNGKENVASIINTNSILVNKCGTYLKNVLLWNPNRNRPKLKDKILKFLKKKDDNEIRVEA